MVASSSEKRFETAGKWVLIDLGRCMGAGNCVSTCPADVYKVINGTVDASNIGNCISCAACKKACVSNVILDHHAW